MTTTTIKRPNREPLGWPACPPQFKSAAPSPWACGHQTVTFKR